MTYNVEPVKAQFPILARRIRGKPLHYLDNAATAQTPQYVLDAVLRHETMHRANVLRSIHTLAEEATEAYEQARHDIARFVNAGAAEEIVFTSGCTGAINLAAYSFGSGLQAGDEVVVSLLEHHSNIVPWQMLRDRRGIVLKAIPPTADGRLDLAALPAVITDRCRLIAVTHASNVTGAETTVSTIVEAARAVGAKVLLDGAQRVPHGPVDVQALGIDFYAFSSHKMFGPNGIGALWARSDILKDMVPFQGGGEMIQRVTLDRTTFADPPRRFEAGTPPIAQAVGMAAASRWILAQDIDGAGAYLQKLMERVLAGLETLDRGTNRIRILGPRGLQARLPVISFAIEGLHPHDVCQFLDGHGVALRGGHHCAQPLMDFFNLSGTTRVSLALYNTEADVDAFLNGLEDTLRRFQ